MGTLLASPMLWLGLGLVLVAVGWGGRMGGILEKDRSPPCAGDPPSGSKNPSPTPSAAAPEGQASIPNLGQILASNAKH